MIITKLLRRMRKPALLLSQILLILTVGCGSEPIELTVMVPTATNTVTPTMQPQSTETPQATPTLTLIPFTPKAVIKIVSPVPLSGDQASFGEEIMRATQMAIQQLGSPLNELGYQVELATYDDQNLMDIALANAQEIAADSQILCGVGHYDPAITIEASNLYHQAGLAFIAPDTTDPLLTDRSFVEVNRLIGRIDGQGIVAAKFAQDQGYKTAYIVSQKNEGYARNADAFRVESGKLGIKRLGSLASSLNDEHTKQYIDLIVNAKPDVLYIAAATRQAIPFLVQLRAAGYTGAFLGTDRLNSRSAISDAGSSLIEGGGLFYTILSPPVQYYSDASQFRNDFQEQFGAAARSLALRAYDATGVCLKAIEEASKAKGGELPTRSEVANALRSLKDYKGITGTYNFNNHGDPDPGEYYVFQVVTTNTDSWDQNQVVASYGIPPP